MSLTNRQQFIAKDVDCMCVVSATEKSLYLNRYHLSAAPMRVEGDIPVHPERIFIKLKLFV